MAVVMLFVVLVMFVVAAAAVHDRNRNIAVDWTMIAVVPDNHAPLVDRAATGAVTAAVGVTGAAMAVGGLGILGQGKKDDAGKCDQ